MRKKIKFVTLICGLIFCTSSFSYAKEISSAKTLCNKEAYGAALAFYKLIHEKSLVPLENTKITIGDSFFLQDQPENEMHNVKINGSSFVFELGVVMRSEKCLLIEVQNEG